MRDGTVTVQFDSCSMAVASKSHVDYFAIDAWYVCLVASLPSDLFSERSHHNSDSVEAKRLAVNNSSGPPSIQDILPWDFEAALSQCRMHSAKLKFIQCQGAVKIPHASVVRGPSLPGAHLTASLDHGTFFRCCPRSFQSSNCQLLAVRIFTEFMSR